MTPGTPHLAMDDDLLLLHNAASQYQLEINEEAELLDWMRLLTAVLIVGSNEDHAWCYELDPEGIQ